MTDTISRPIKQAGRLDTAIKKAKEALLKKARKKGITENLGQAEAAFIRDKFIVLSDYSDDMLRKRTQMDAFDSWCANLDDAALQEDNKGGLFSS